MVFSMTGFGRGEHRSGETAVSVEVRSVNHRYSDISIRTPKSISFLEDRIRQYIQSRISRGRVDVYVSYEMGELKQTDVLVDYSLAQNYYSALKDLKDRMDLEGSIPVSLVATFADVISVRQGELMKRHYGKTFFRR